MKIICIGRNYKDHIDELDNEMPREPVVFLKPGSAVLPAKHPFYLPAFSREIHFETEIIVKINRSGKYISPRFAHKYFDEIGLGIDFTARDLQNELKEKGLPWEKAKAFDGSAIIGKFVPKDLFDIRNLNFHLNINGRTVQRGNTSLMLWDVGDIISYVSRFFTLKLGDIIFTGTPAGTGKVNPGDTLEGYIENKLFLKVNVK